MSKLKYRPTRRVATLGPYSITIYYSDKESQYYWYLRNTDKSSHKSRCSNGTAPTLAKAKAAAENKLSQQKECNHA